MIRRYRHITQRPDTFRLNPDAELAQGLVFAGLAPGGLVGSTHYHDSSLYGNHGTLTNMDPATDWVFDPTLGRWATEFAEASTQNVVKPGSLPGLPSFVTYDLSVCLWAKVPSASEAGAFFELGGTTGDADGVIFGVGAATMDATSTGNELIILHENVRWIDTGSTIGTDWVHLAVLFPKSGTTAWYINGTYINESSGKSPRAPGQTGTNVALRIGGYQVIYYGITYNRYVNAKIADVLAYPRLITPAEIQQLADPSNVMLSGLILPPRRMVFPAAVTSAPSIPSGSATISAVADLAATGYAQHSGSATLSAIASLTATGYAQHSGSATLSAIASLTATGYAQHSGSATLSAVASLAATGYHQSIASATISAIADLTAVGYTSHAGTADLSAIADLSATGYTSHVGSADLSAIADMVAVGESPSIIPEGSATLSAVADLSATGYASHAGEAVLSAVADIAAVGYHESAGYAVLAAVADMVAVGSVPGEEGEGGTGTGGKTADGLTWPDVDGLEWEEVDSLPWSIYHGMVAAGQAYTPSPVAAHHYTPAPGGGQYV